METDYLLQFIRKYREMEKMPYEKGYQVIRQIVMEWQYDHVCNHWRGKQREFCSFYLNLGTRTQIRLLRLWGIEDEADEAYLNECEKDEIFALFGKAPETVNRVRSMMLFFNNHGICKHPARGIVMSDLPPIEKMFGNGKNWGNYILSLKEPHELLEVISSYHSRAL
jgi:hypothetical protein